eukprot:gb/GECH01010149.1/.p1 GENE.gb/GECH01010149.1/~~gb/GECH01010149.1/.p1  ORF type:complete len:530 (+),score=100.11 gb/GECH01010149.1/:1-1590(+)
MAQKRSPVHLFCTLTEGFEQIVKEEIQHTLYSLEKYHVYLKEFTHIKHGIIAFKVHINSSNYDDGLLRTLFALCSLRSIDELFSMLAHSKITTQVFQNQNNEAQEYFETIGLDQSLMNWETSMFLWRSMYVWKKRILELPQISEGSKLLDQVSNSKSLQSVSLNNAIKQVDAWRQEISSDELRMRCSCSRRTYSEKHGFKSVDVERWFANGFYQLYHPIVDLTRYTAKLYAHIRSHDFYCGLSLSSPLPQPVDKEHEEEAQLEQQKKLATKNRKQNKQSKNPRGSPNHEIRTPTRPLFKSSIRCFEDYVINRRDIRTVFGQNSMKPSTAYCLLREANIHHSSQQSGLVILDPMAGTGTIPIEAMCHFGDRCRAVIAGDISLSDLKLSARNREYAVKQLNIVKALENVYHENQQFPELQVYNRFNNVMTIMNCNAKSLPFTKPCIDILVTDMPFGKRSGNHKQNEDMYPSLLKEFARVLKPGGIAVLLTTEKTLMKQQLQDNKAWSILNIQSIDMNGLDARIHTLKKQKL